MPTNQNPFIPNLFILGVGKCGTTTLHAYLNNMQDICMSKPKEPFFFEKEFENGLEFYQKKYFAHWKGEPIIGDARNQHLYLPYVAKRIHQVNSNAKLLVMIRNPIDRAFSYWRHVCYHQRLTLSFEELVDDDYGRIKKSRRTEQNDEISKSTKRLLSGSRDRVHSSGLAVLDMGYYYEQIQRYLNLFPRDNLKVILLEDLSAQPEEIMNDLIDYLGLDSSRNKFTHLIHENTARIRVNKRTVKYQAWKLAKSTHKRGLLRESVWQGLRSRLEPKAKKEDLPKMNNQTRSWLREHFREHNEKLGKFLDRDLSHWV